MTRFFALVLVGAVFSAGCDNGASPASPSSPPVGQIGATSGPNVLPISVNGGPTNDGTDTAFTSVTVCAPNTSSCQTIGGIAVDTGSSGLRIMSSVLSLTLPPETDAKGNPVVECMPFLDGYTWGPVQLATVRVASEEAVGLPIQVIGAAAFSTVPDSCSSTGPAQNTVETFGANGVLGVGGFRQDCGSACAFAGAANPNLYFSCPTSGCQPTTVTLSQQVPNPVWLFPTDNNGVVVELPSIAASGAVSANGSLVFGIGTRPNNGLGSAKVFTLDPNGNFTTLYQGRAYSGSFLDTGSNGLYFLDSGTTLLPLCPDYSFLYCPATTQSLSATNQGLNGATGVISFSVANADALFVNPTFSAFDNLAGPNLGSFDWGLPFFFGRNVFFAIESQNTPAGLGPYVAY